jgi:acyl-CoA thioester hydrolase
MIKHKNNRRRGETMKPNSYVQPDPQTWLAKFHFSIPLKVRYCETDMLGHLNNVSYFIYFEQGRMEYWQNLQLSDELFNEETICVAADLACQYVAQVYLQEPLRLYVRVAKLGRSSYDLEYALVEAETGQLKATGRGAMVYIDKKLGTSLPLPAAARDKIMALEGADLSV